LNHIETFFLREKLKKWGHHIIQIQNSKHRHVNDLGIIQDVNYNKYIDVNIQHIIADIYCKTYYKEKKFYYIIQLYSAFANAILF
jgi:hypothetical protein